MSPAGPTKLSGIARATDDDSVRHRSGRRSRGEILLASISNNFFSFLQDVGMNAREEVVKIPLKGVIHSRHMVLTPFPFFLLPHKATMIRYLTLDEHHVKNKQRELFRLSHSSGQSWYCIACMNVGIPQWSGELETQRFCVHDMFSLSPKLSSLPPSQLRSPF